jgi:3-oxoadipate enol-lactonase
MLESAHKFHSFHNQQSGTLRRPYKNAEATQMILQEGQQKGRDMASEALHVLDVGDSERPTLVLLHALGMGGWMWQPHLAVLAAHYHVLAPDLPGCAGSVAAGPFTMEKAATALVDLIRTRGHGPAHICGVSLGAMVALPLYRLAPELVASLVLSGGQVHPNRFFMTLQEALVRCMPERQLVESLSGSFRRQYPELVEPALKAARQTGKRNLLAATYAVSQSDLRPILPTITVPTLVLCGSKDRFNLRAARQMSKAIPGAQLRIVPNVSHIWNLEQPQLFTNTILEFVQ